MSFITLILGNVVNGGSIKDSQGNQFNGTYYPETEKSGARWVGTYFVNRGSYVAQNGEVIDIANTPLNLTGFSKKGTKGLAELLAKIQIGQPMTFNCDIRHFNKTVYYPGTNQPIMVEKKDGQGRTLVDPQGKPLTEELKVPSLGINILNIVEWGREPEERIKAEEANWTGQGNFFSRPKGWNVKGSPEAEAWSRIKKWRRELVYQPGMKTFGRSIVDDTKGTKTAYQAPQTQQAPQSQSKKVEVCFDTQPTAAATPTQSTKGTGTGLTLPPATGVAYTPVNNAIPAGKLF